MKIMFDPAKREATYKERGLDFAAAEAVFAGPTYSAEDTRRAYGETRIITVGLLDERMGVVGWTPRDGDRHVFSMRKANDREQAKYFDRLVQG